MLRMLPPDQNQRSARADNDSDYGSDDEGRFKERIIIPTPYQREHEEIMAFITPANQIVDDEYNATLLTPTKYKAGENFSSTPPRPAEPATKPRDDDYVPWRRQPDTPARQPLYDDQRQPHRPPSVSAGSSGRTNDQQPEPSPARKPTGNRFDDDGDGDVRPPIRDDDRQPHRPPSVHNDSFGRPTGQRVDPSPARKTTGSRYDGDSDQDVPANRQPKDPVRQPNPDGDRYLTHQPSSQNGLSSQPTNQRTDPSSSRKLTGNRHGDDDDAPDANYSPLSQENITLIGRTHVFNGDIEFKSLSGQLQSNDGGSHQSQVEFIFRTKLTGAQVRELVGQNYERVAQHGSSGQVPRERSPPVRAPSQGEKPAREASDSDFDTKDNYRQRQTSNATKPRPPVPSYLQDRDSDVDTKDNLRQREPPSPTKPRPHVPSYLQDRDSDLDEPPQRPKPGQSTTLAAGAKKDHHIGRSESIGRHPEDSRPQADRTQLFNPRKEHDGTTPSLTTTLDDERKDDPNAYNFGAAKGSLTDDDEIECTVLARETQPGSRRDQFATGRYQNPTTTKTTTDQRFGLATDRATETDHYRRPADVNGGHYQTPLSAGVAERESARNQPQLAPQGSYGGYSTSTGRVNHQPASREFDEPSERQPVSYPYQQSARPYDSSTEEDLPNPTTRLPPTVVNTYDTYEVDPDTRSDYRPSSEYSRTQPAGISALVQRNPMHHDANPETQSQDSRLTTTARPSSKQSKADKEAVKKQQKQQKKAEEDRKKLEKQQAKRSGSKSRP